MKLSTEAEKGRVWFVRKTIKLSDLVMDKRGMTEVMNSGRKSRTPDTPIWVRIRHDDSSKYGVMDGHHRVADALRRGQNIIEAEVEYPRPDFESLSEVWGDAK